METDQKRPVVRFNLELVKQTVALAFLAQSRNVAVKRGVLLRTGLAPEFGEARSQWVRAAVQSCGIGGRRQRIEAVEIGKGQRPVLAVQGE